MLLMENKHWGNILIMVICLFIYIYIYILDTFEHVLGDPTSIGERGASVSEDAGS